MSEEDKSYTSVLLPTASVALFTVDNDTKNAFHALENDWRFARVTLETIEGDVNTAAKTYSAYESPDLIIVQTEDIDAGFSDRLETLAGTLSEGTSAIVIGPVNDVNLYRKLVGMGVSDYLVKPVQTETLGNDIGKVLLEQIGASDSRLIAVLGAKGGVGVTTVCESLAWSVSGDLKQKTFLMDIAGGWSTLSVGMNFEPTTTLSEAVRAAADGNEDSLTRMIHKASDKLFILASGGDVMLDDSADSDKFEALLEYLMALYPVIIIDLSAGSPALKRTVLKRAHQTLMVTTPTLPSVRAARTLLQEIKEVRGGDVDNIEIILNMVNYAPKSEVPKAQIQEGLDQPLAVTIPFDAEIFVSTESEGEKLSNHKQGGGLAHDIVKPVQKFLDISVAEKTQKGDAGDKKVDIGKILTRLRVKS